MITILVAQRPTPTSNPAPTEPPVSAAQDEKKPNALSPGPTHTVRPTFVPIAKRVQPSQIDGNNEQRNITIMILAMVFTLIVPALLLVIYLILNPDAFMIDITPEYDISSWQLGERPQLVK